MDIDNLTFKELEQIAKMFGDVFAQENQDLHSPISLTTSGGTVDLVEKEEHPFIGEFCIARSYLAGVHAGEVVSVNGENVVLKDSYRLRSWVANDGIALSGVAQHGISKEKTKLDTKNPLIYLTRVCELIPCSQSAKESING